MSELDQCPAELRPTPRAHRLIEHLPLGSTVSITASPSRDLDATLELAARLLDASAVDGLHVFTFNQVDATVSWQRQVLLDAGHD